MNKMDIHQRKTDRAWDRLYARLDEDGLLAGAVAPCRKTKRLPSRGIRLLAAVALLCLVVAGVYHYTLQNNRVSSFLTLRNAEEATTLITTLEDGSVVYLAEKAVLRYPSSFETDRREVALEGNAQFDVSGNKERPFLISTENVHVEVVGTSFRIRNEGNAPFELSVKSGVVKVVARESGQSSLVNAGEIARLQAGEWQINKMEANRDPMKRIRFKDERLGDVLRILNQEISSVPLLTIPALEDRSFTVAFEGHSPVEMAEVICLGLGLAYTQTEEGLLITEP
ncbi:ferric-dicitrate binding protein FerR (iron transport regulator) [Parabacteroides sp. PFB2-12]|nr:FecR family protein [Parabacteroides sp. PFB2-12]MDH6389177.1 ferric-dicitrate binding protein FerR (iron transport regulator) [Parabacteroides sp. PFB2-12]